MTTYEDGLLKVEYDGGCADIDFLKQPEDGAWIGFGGVDIRLTLVPGEDGDCATLLVSVWEPEVVSGPLASLETPIGRKD